MVRPFKLPKIPKLKIPRSPRLPKMPKVRMVRPFKLPKVPRSPRVFRSSPIRSFRQRRARGLYSPHRARSLKFKNPLEAVVALAFFAALVFIPPAIDFAEQHPVETALLSPIPIGLISLAVYWKVRRRWQRLRALKAVRLADVDNMSGRRFERYLAALFRHHGYDVQETGRSGDQGCDLLLSKDGEKIVCQAKRYHGRVSNDAVQQAVAAIALYHCHRAMVVTNSRFTDGARRLAAANNCELVDREQLGELIARFRENRGWS